MPPEFSQYAFKVLSCPLKQSHDWGACMFAHNKEQARRRDPRRFYYNPVTAPTPGRAQQQRGARQARTCHPAPPHTARWGQAMRRTPRSVDASARPAAAGSGRHTVSLAAGLRPHPPATTRPWPCWVLPPQVMCPYAKMGAFACPKGDSCDMAHHV